MEIKYNKKLGGYQILYLPNIFLDIKKWHTPVNNKIYESWGSAMHDLDKWAE